MKEKIIQIIIDPTGFWNDSHGTSTFCSSIIYALTDRGRILYKKSADDDWRVFNCNRFNEEGFLMIENEV